MKKCPKCNGTRKITWIVGDNYGVQKLKEKKIKCNYCCKGKGKIK